MGMGMGIGDGEGPRTPLKDYNDEAATKVNVETNKSRPKDLLVIVG